MDIIKSIEHEQLKNRIPVLTVGNTVKVHVKIKDGDKVVIIEDVTTSGKSIEETFPIIKAQGSTPDSVKIVGLMVSLNRQERGKGKKCALDEITELYGFPARAIVSMSEVVEHLYNKPRKDGSIMIDDSMKTAIDNYYKEYGAQ